MEFDNEVKKLEEIKSAYKDLTHEYEIKIQNAIKEHKKNPLLCSSLIDQYNNKLAMLKKTINNPFFGRIDFQNNNDENLICYISKVGVLDEDGNAITVDWRAPISTLYYDSDVGKAQFTSPAGLEKGILNLKRQYTIEKGKLINFQDVNTISNDELLKPFLENNIDKRLKNIVSTIQSEQNAIIRKPLNENNIIQGAAGSGKTTVALHRIAYLVYNEQKRFNEDAFLVIGPNSYFMKYISSVLPDLDVFNVSQYTFLDIVKNYLKEKINIIDQSEVLENVLDGMDISIIKFKSSLLYKDIVDEYINDLEESIVHGPIKLMNYTLFKEDVIEKFINKKSLGIVERINEFIKYAKSYIKKHEDVIKNNYWNIYREEYLTSNDEKRKKEILDVTEEFNKKIKNIDSLLKDYFKDYTLKPLAIYRNFINDFDKYSDYPLNKEEDIKKINKKTLGYEDLAALVYINLRFYGYKGNDKYIHVVLDEAQDFSLFHYFVIKKLFKNATFSIFGDLAQSIYSYQSIDNWEDVKSIIYNNDINILFLDKSYRTTCEIMAAANKVSGMYGFGMAQSFLRHGPEVSFIKYNIINLLEKIDTLKKSGYSNIAVICKSKKSIEKYVEDINVSGVSVITSYLSKGLEFDCCIVIDMDFDRNNMLEMKLLYVAMTRALHELIIVTK